MVKELKKFDVVVAAYRRPNDLDRISGVRVDMLSSRGGGRHLNLGATEA